MKDSQRSMACFHDGGARGSPAASGGKSLGQPAKGGLAEADPRGRGAGEVRDPAADEGVLLPFSVEEGAGTAATKDPMPQAASRHGEAGPHGGARSPTDPVRSIMEDNRSRPIYVPERLARVVLLHFVKNLRSWAGAATALILAVAGPFGCCKTSILREICFRLGIKLFEIGAWEFESQLSNVPAEKIIETYFAAAEAQRKTGCPSALLLDDFDLALGRFSDGLSGTTNRQHAYAIVMSIADSPTKVAGRYVERVPFLVTANDLSKLYGGLSRPIRMQAVLWNPSREDQISIIRHIFREVLNEAQLHWLLSVTPKWTLAHFAQLKSALLDGLIEADWRGFTAVEYLRLCREGTSPSRAWASKCAPVPSSVLDAAFARVEQESEAKQDLTRSRCDGQAGHGLCSDGPRPGAQEERECPES